MNAPKSSGTGNVEPAALFKVEQQLKPEWLRVRDAITVFGLSRSSLYELIAWGKIRSVCLRRRGAKHGIRLINFDSLMAYIEQAGS